MKAAQISIRPKFDLMKQSDVVSFYHMQMPRWLFVHSKYKTISLEAKVAYTFLLNRFQLSKLNGWVNDENEVFVIFTRESLADEMGISYRKAIECFKELTSVNLVWERRPGRGQANQIYLASVILDEADANKNCSAPFGNDNSRSTETAHQENPSDVDISEPLQLQEVLNPHIKECENCSSATANSAVLDMPKSHTSKYNTSYIDFSDKDISQSFVAGKRLTGVSSKDGRVDKNLAQIINNCELGLLPPEIAGTFKNAIERLYYADSFKLDGIILPQEKVRSDLLKLESSMVMEAYRKMKKNTDKVVKNSTAYLMAVIYNCIFEVCSDVLIDPDMNSMEMQFGGFKPCF